MLPIKILLFSADEAISSSITPCLQHTGYKVKLSSTGVGAMDLILVEKPSLIILDIELPDINSLAIIRSLRSEEFSSHTPVILIGSNLQEEDVLIGLEVGADLCLLETFHPQLFVARVRSLLRRVESLKFR